MATCKLLKGEVPMNIDNSVIGNRTYSALKLLYQNSEDMQNCIDAGGYKTTYPIAYAKEFATIKLCTARGSGHSTAISKFVNEYKNNYAILSFNLKMAEHLKEYVRFSSLSANRLMEKHNSQYIKYDDGNEIFFGSMHNFRNCLTGHNIGGIIVDCASLWSKEKIEELYKVGLPCMGKRNKQYFIFVE